MTDVRYPDMRVNVIDAVRDLADPEYQWKVWVRQESPRDDFGFNFDFSLNILDDLRILEAPEETLGGVLRGREEVDAMRTLANALNSLFDQLGTNLSDEQYITSPQWVDVVGAAKEALTALLRPDQ